MSRRDLGVAAALVLTVSGIGLSVAWLIALLDRAGERVERLEARAAALAGALEAEKAATGRAQAAREEALARALRAEARAGAAVSTEERLRARVAALEARAVELEARAAAAGDVAREAPVRAEVAPAPVEAAPDPEAAPAARDVTPAVATFEPATSLAEVVARGRGRVRVAGDVSLDLVFVPPGRGSVGLDPAALPPAERAARALLPAAGFASPRVPVRLEEGFLVLAREVTSGQYLAVLAAGGVDLAARRRVPGYLAHLEQRPPGWEDQPVTCVSWAEAAEFCALLGRLLGAPARLPSEVEWELVAAGCGDAPRRFPWGDASASSTVSGARPDPPTAASDVDRTPDGVLDLGRGVHEWCVDPWRARRWSEVAGLLFHRPSTVVVPVARASDPMACRGGSASTRSALQVECAWRQGRLAGTRGPTLGFRVVVPVGR